MTVTLQELRQALQDEVDSWSRKNPPTVVSVPALFLTDVLGQLGQVPEWIDVHDRLPESDTTVLAVKELKNGRRDICIARCILEWEHYDRYTNTYTTMPYWVTGGNNNILYWMELPEIPEKEA